MSDRYDTPRWNEDEVPELGGSATPRLDDADALDLSSENVLEDWPGSSPAREGGGDDDGVPESVVSAPATAIFDTDDGEGAAEADLAGAPAGAAGAPDEAGEGTTGTEADDGVHAPFADHLSETAEHAPGDLTVPPGFAVLEGEARGGRRTVGVVVARFNGDVTTRMLESALDELESRGVDRDSITVMPVPGAFELPLAAMALAKTRRFACVVALGCVIRGDTPHFDFVSSEAASGLQLAGIETGVPVSFGVLTLDRIEQADARIVKGAEAVRTALEMADLFANLRAAAAKG